MRFTSIEGQTPQVAERWSSAAGRAAFAVPLAVTGRAACQLGRLVRAACRAGGLIPPFLVGPGGRGRPPYSVARSEGGSDIPAQERSPSSVAPRTRPAGGRRD